MPPQKFDTLVKTRSFVYVKNGNKTKKLTPGEYAIYEEKPGDEFDYSDFEFVKNADDGRYTKCDKDITNANWTRCLT